MLKHFPFRNLLPAMVILAFAMTIAGCSAQKNTAKSRWWHAFNARYNTYYNGTVAYIEGSLEKENGNKDNYSEMIPYYTVGNKNSRELGKSNYDRAIEKCEKAIHQHSIKRRPVWDKKRRKTAKDLEWLHRREYNPFLWKAYGRNLAMWTRWPQFDPEVACLDGSTITTGLEAAAFPMTRSYGFDVKLKF